MISKETLTVAERSRSVSENKVIRLRLRSATN